VTLPDSERPGFSGRRKPPRGPLVLLTLLVVFAAALAGGYALGRPRVVLSNRLLAPIRVAAEGTAPDTVAAGGSTQIAVPWGKSLVVSWELVQPLSADNRPMGEPMTGSLLVRQRWGTLQRAVEARGPHGNFFAPLVTNASPDLLRVTVNAGLEGALDCGCAVRPDARRAFVGYYRLYQNSTVQARSGKGRAATFRDLGSKVVTPEGSIGLRFEGRDLRGP
jgi:hypothetical protein